jgi:uncharacterized protein YbgA (DUF1722 family)/uncharacterized protein YbbK (DUF523 family)
MSVASAGTPPIRIGISSCLLGAKVRFDGGHKRDGFLTDTIGPFVEWVPVCPEVEAGFGTPRETMRLERVSAAEKATHAVRLLTTKTKIDLTDQLVSYSARRVVALESEGLSGYVLKKDSPSCGMERVKVYDGHGSPARTGRGIFAEHLRARFPSLPVEEEGRLSDPRLRENFVERIFAYRRLQTLFDGRWTVGDLVAFHTAHKLVLMAHSVEAYRRLGRLVAGATGLTRPDVARDYATQFMAALTAVATPRRHASVLLHMAGYFKTHLDAGSRAELLETIEAYRKEFVPLIVPITLFRHHVRQHQVAYLAGQVYLDPHPRELMLRNHV